jgi:hypothetical protein
MRKKRTRIMTPKCDWCGEPNQYFIATANKKIFCREQYVGQEPTKDCHTKYLNHLKEQHVLKQRLQQEEQIRLQKEKEERKKEKIKAAPVLNKNLEELYNRLGTKKSKQIYL